jgi:photosystem II stability/assembly factor-like uncharacterized protein
MRKLSMFFGFLMLLSSVSILAQLPPYYTYNTNGTNNSFPFNIAAGKMVQSLFLPADFNQPTPAPSGMITHFWFRVADTYPLAHTYTDLYIRMGRTSLTSLPTGTFYTGTMDTVFKRASHTITQAGGTWYQFTLDTPFRYYNDSSIVIEIGQCAVSPGTGFSICYTNVSGNRRTYNTTGCPYVYSGQGAAVYHYGLTLAPFSVNCTYSWTAQTSGVTGTLYSVKAVNDQVAWVCGAAATVRRTTDGGATWTNANPNPGVINGDVYNIEALDANTAWCTTSPSATYIYKTTNGGTNWVQVYTVAGGFINAIKMTTPTNGIATGDVLAGVWLILGTTDGGSNWSVLSSPTGTGDGRNNCLQVIGSNVWFGTGQGTVWRSTNAGINWTSSPTTPLTTQVLGIRFNNASTGFVSGASMVKTTDGGATWTAVTVPGTGNISGIDGNGSDYWFVRGTGIYRSTDGGTNWTQVHTAVGTLNDIKIATGTNGCLVGWTCATGGNIAKMTGVPVGIGNNNNEIPQNYSLSQNYPNPFNPVTSINFAIPVAGFTELKVYDALGREVAVLFSSVAPAGNHSVNFDASSLSSGIYFYTLKSGDFTFTRKMALIK